MNDLLRTLSARERRLALAVGVLVMVALVWFILSKTLGRLRELDAAIGQSENHLMACAELDARGTSVEQAYAAMASEHSSSWTETEIHNRLRDEIYRLAQEDPDAASGSTRNVVEIPSLHQGKLNDAGQGYREYQLAINITPTDIYSVLKFLARLHNSNQSLRIDGLELARHPESSYVSAAILVTRTVVEASPDSASSSPSADHDDLETDRFFSENVELSVVTEIGGIGAQGGSCVKAKATADDASLSLPQQVDAGIRYELTVDAAATGPASLSVKSEDAPAPHEGAITLREDGKAYRYTMSFVVPDAPGSSNIHAPYLTLNKTGTEVFVDNVTIKSVEP